MSIGPLLLDSSFLGVLAINVLLAYSAYYGLWSGGFVLVFAAFGGVGAYAFALTVSDGGLWVGVGVLIALGVAGAVAAVIAWPLRRVGGIYLGIISIGFVVLCQSTESHWTQLTNGTDGIVVPAESAVSTTTVIVAAVVVLALTFVVERSVLGLVLKARRVDSLLAMSVGVNVRRIWYWLLVTSAVIAAIGGAMRAGWLGFVSPTDFSFSLLVTIVAMVILGGSEHWSGPLIGAAAFTVLNQLLQSSGEWAAVINGSVLLVVVLVAPAGIAGNTRRALVRAFAKRERGAANAAEVEPAREVEPVERRGVAHAAGGSKDGADVSREVLSVVGVSWRMGRLQIIDDVSLTLAPGEICGLVGPNGSGKSSLLNVLSGITAPDSGRVIVDGVDMTQRKAHEFARSGVSRTFQGVRVMENESALANVRVARWRDAPDGTLLHLVSRVRDRRRASKALATEAAEMLSRAGASEFSSWLVGDVSYGTRRKVELARSLVTCPQVLLLDEPTSGVSGEHIELMKRLIVEEARRGCGVLIVDHDLDVIKGICDRVVVIDAGEKIYDGSVDAAFLNPEVQEAYVGA